MSEILTPESWFDWLLSVERVQLGHQFCYCYLTSLWEGPLGRPTKPVGLSEASLVLADLHRWGSALRGAVLDSHHNAFAGLSHVSDSLYYSSMWRPEDLAFVSGTLSDRWSILFTVDIDALHQRAAVAPGFAGSRPTAIYPATGSSPHHALDLPFLVLANDVTLDGSRIRPIVLNNRAFPVSL